MALSAAISVQNEDKSVIHVENFSKHFARFWYLSSSDFHYLLNQPGFLDLFKMDVHSNGHVCKDNSQLLTNKIIKMQMSVPC